MAPLQVNWYASYYEPGTNAPYAGELGSDEQRRAEALNIFEDRSTVLRNVNQWCPGLRLPRSRGRVNACGLTS